MRSTIRRHVFPTALWLALGLAAALFPERAAAQLAGSGTINGAVTDATGAVVPAVDITIRNTDTGIERKTETSDAGIYNAAFLAPGNYDVHAAKTGFAPMLRKDLTLQVGQTLTINFTLAVASSATEVTVTGAAPVVDAEKTEVSQVVSESAVDNLPIAGRRWDSFVLLTPNVTTDGTSGLVSYRGISGLYNSNTVDGANNNQALFSEARGRAISGAYVYSLDSIKEYQVTASNYSAELGQAAGGVVNAVTKSGTNDLHGDLFYYLRYPTWNALDPFPKSQGNYSQPIHQWQQFGASVGGPHHQGQAVLSSSPTTVRARSTRSLTPAAPTARPVAALPCPSQVTATQCAAANAFLSGAARQLPARHQPGCGLRQTGLPGHSAQPPQHVVRLHELPRAQRLQHVALATTTAR